MKLFKSLISVLFSVVLLLSASSSFAIDKLHFVIGGGAGGGNTNSGYGTQSGQGGSAGGTAIKLLDAAIFLNGPFTAGEGIISPFLSSKVRI